MFYPKKKLNTDYLFLCPLNKATGPQVLTDYTAQQQPEKNDNVLVSTN